MSTNVVSAVADTALNPVKLQTIAVYLHEVVLNPSCPPANHKILNLSGLSPGIKHSEPIKTTSTVVTPIKMDVMAAYLVSSK